MESYLTPSSVCEFETVIKRSRFMALCAPAQGREQAKKIIATRAQRYSDANHHCWAMIAGEPWNVNHQDQSDDGEPRGSAGKPMLNVLQHAEIGQIVVVVTRYFGGTKLGVGGLVRAYSDAVVGVLDIATTKRVYVRTAYRLTLPYSLLASLEYFLEQLNCEVTDKEYAVDVQMTVHVPVAQLPELQAYVEQLGKGAIPMALVD